METVQVVISEYGTNLSVFPTKKQFISHVTLAPHQALSGGQAAQEKEEAGQR